MEPQLTTAAHGHILTNVNVWSPDGRWIVYDTRSDPAGKVFDGTRIERVHVETGAVQVLYESAHGANFGPPTAPPTAAWRSSSARSGQRPTGSMRQTTAAVCSCGTTGLAWR